MIKRTRRGGAREKARTDNRQSDGAEYGKRGMQKEHLRREGDAKGYPVLESGRCVPGPDRTEPDRTVLAGSLIKIFTRRDVRAPGESLRHSVLSIIRCHVPYGIFGIQGVLHGCPLVLAGRERRVLNE